MRSRRGAVGLAAALMLMVAACGDDADVITVDGAWARNSPLTSGAGAGYLQLTSSDDDTLLGITVDPSFARAGELHDVVMVESTDSTMAGSMDVGGGMMMVAVDEVPLPARVPVVLEPGHLHLMFVDLVAPLEIGDTFEVTLQFERAPDIVVEFEVREEAP
ncbi:MAG: copper chaperone PCu(A)C [Acidimicrobiia bacterium]|nr:copper chaperone PCu(A)C [Acidimicrobiia bacterium]